MRRALVVLTVVAIAFGLFTWDDHAGEHHREIDNELSRWGDPSGPPATPTST
jgi:hypothetical protein